VDADSDGFIDHAYFGDLQGNMWQIQFCTKAALQSNPNCNTSNWKGSLLLAAPSGSANYPIYFPPTVTTDSNGDLWVTWANGDAVNDTGPAASVYGLKALLCTDGNGNPSPCSIASLANITNAQTNANPYCATTSQKVGWVMNLQHNNEQVLAPLAAFNNVLYFTSFVPASGSNSACTSTGTSYLYAVGMETGSAYCNVGQSINQLGSGVISVDIGTGIASAPIISIGPSGSAGIYVTVSGAGGQLGGTSLSNVTPAPIATWTNLLYWKDLRLQ
jgi:type IV pilus assembly protein PilY1